MDGFAPPRTPIKRRFNFAKGMRADDKEEYSEEEAAKRRDEVLKKMLNTPPKPHKPKEPKRQPQQSKRD